MKYSRRRLGPSIKMWLPFYGAGAITHWMLVSPKAVQLVDGRQWVVLFPLVAAWLYVGKPWRVVVEMFQMLTSRGSASVPSRRRPVATRVKTTAPRSRAQRAPRAQRAEQSVPDVDDGSDDETAQVIQLPRVAREAVLEHLLDNFDDIVTSARERGRS